VITEYESEPIPGLPGLPPRGERVLWQGSPDWRGLARTAFHTRLIGAYFGLLTALAAINTARGGGMTGLVITATLGVVVLLLLNLLAWGTARSTIYTVTNRRIVLRVGMALPKCVNLPLALVGSADMRRYADGSGDIPLQLTAKQQLGYLMLWPHARPWRFGAPEPMMRAVPDVASVAGLIARACLAAQPDTGAATPIKVPTADAPATPAYAGAVTA